MVIMAALVSFQMFAQTAEEYKARYERLVARLGHSGVGVEGILDKWAQVDSTDVDMLVARFQMYFEKSRDNKVVDTDSKKYLGLDPILTLKDSTGTNRYYFQVPVFDDEVFGDAMRSIEKAIKLYPERLDLRIDKATALLAYETDSPDMTTSFLLSLIDEWNSKKHSWTYPEAEVDKVFFDQVIQEYCGTLFGIATDKSRESFKTLAEKMLLTDKNNPEFLSDLGSYYVVKKDNKKAMKYYDKILKTTPDYYPAIKNCCTMAVNAKDAKLQKKYLPYMVKYGTEAESISAKARLAALN